ncbi:MAG: translocation/assembly module TamB domain-containing protein [Polyangiaceae bacterium]
MSRPRQTAHPVEAADPARDGPRDVRRHRRRRDWGGTFARLLCGVFALIGVIPLAAGALARVEWVQRWAAEQTSRLLDEQLGVHADYRLDLSPWPLTITLHDLVIHASDGGEPFLQAKSVVARPRIFSILAGKPDLGALEVEDARIVAVVEDGELTNLRYTLPETSSESSSSELPLSSVAVTNAAVDITVDDLRVVSEAIDVDVNVSRLRGEGTPLIPAGVFEVALRTGQTRVDRRHPSPEAPDYAMLDEDVVCALDLRARIADDVLVRHFDLRGVVDFEGDAGTRPSCDLPEDDWRHLSLSLEGGEVRFGPDQTLERLDGRVALRAPAALAHRFVDLPPVAGWVALDLDRLHYDPSRKLPEAEGSLRGAELGIDTKTVARKVVGEIRVERDVIHVADMKVDWAGGVANLPEVSLSPFEEGMPLQASDILIEGVKLEDLLDDLAAHPHAHVGWVLETSRLSRFGGTLMPLDLSGPIVVESRDFGVYDQPTSSPIRRRLMGVQKGNITGTFGVTENAILLSNMLLDTGRSRVKTTVSLGYTEQLGLTLYEGSTIDLADVSPLVAIEMAGKAELSGEGHGEFADPHFTADLAVDDFVFAGFSIGDIVSSKVEFAPLVLDFREARIKKGNSDVDVPQLQVDFDDGDADVVARGVLDSRRGGLFLDDFFRMVNLLPHEGRPAGSIPKQDPTWEQLKGHARGVATIEYLLGGRRDRCGSGRLGVSARLDLDQVDLYGMAFDGGEVDVDWQWDDIDSGDQGLVVDVNSGVLRLGTGTIVAKASVRRGAKLHADVVGTAVPIDEIQQFRDAFGLAREEDNSALRRIRPEATVSFIAGLGGTLGRLEGSADVEISAMRIGPDLLPASRFRLGIVPGDRPEPAPSRYTRCGNAVSRPFDPQRWLADEASGVYALSGELFAGQISFDDVQITQQRSSLLSGGLTLERLDLGALANLLPDVAFSASPPRGHLTAEVQIDEIPLDDPGLAEIRLFVEEAVIERRRAKLRIADVGDPILLSGDALRIPTMPVDLELGGGRLRTRVLAGGVIEDLSDDPKLNVGAQLAPIDVASLGIDIPSVERAAGEVRANLSVRGSLDSPALSGQLGLEDGMLRLKNLPMSLDDINVDLRIEEGEVEIRRATARVGNTGRLAMNGRIPLRGFDIATADATLVATDIRVPVAEGVRLTADARLHATYVPSNDPSQPSLPNITGRVTLKQFAYTRPISFQLDIDSLTGGGRTVVESYNPENDNVTFDVAVVSPQPLSVSNNLLDMRLDLGQSGIRLSGTDQRFGARGQLRIIPGSNIFLQGHDFAIGDGTVTFDNPTRIAPKLDVTATTNFTRYSSAAAATSTASSAGSSTAQSANGGRWRITMHAYGDTDSPEVRFSSDPPLSQEDIVLLLQVGMTRAELDRNLSGALAQTVGLEALNAVTGLDQAFRDTVPIIDEFRVGTQYSARTGRPEPSLTLGKRITEDVRASVTTGLGEEREVRGNIEWRLKGGVSVQGSYDSVNDVSNAGIGNIGAGLRWRIEFE